MTTFLYFRCWKSNIEKMCLTVGDNPSTFNATNMMKLRVGDGSNSCIIYSTFLAKYKAPLKIENLTTKDNASLSHIWSSSLQNIFSKKRNEIRMNNLKTKKRWKVFIISGGVVLLLLLMGLASKVACIKLNSNSVKQNSQMQKDESSDISQIVKEQ
ncbi:hypothetical protein SNEBB_001277 [Seison nebaliae]|nr:hypothetical protein SNEBB_001277 [Seison nebaliae]